MLLICAVLLSAGCHIIYQPNAAWWSFSVTYAHYMGRLKCRICLLVIGDSLVGRLMYHLGRGAAGVYLPFPTPTVPTGPLMNPAPPCIALHPLLLYPHFCQTIIASFRSSWQADSIKHQLISLSPCNWIPPLPIIISYMQVWLYTDVIALSCTPVLQVSFKMTMHSELPPGMDEVDVIIAGGEHESFYN